MNISEKSRTRFNRKYSFIHDPFAIATCPRVVCTYLYYSDFYRQDGRPKLPSLGTNISPPKALLKMIFFSQGGIWIRSLEGTSNSFHIHLRFLKMVISDQMPTMNFCLTFILMRFSLVSTTINLPIKVHFWSWTLWF